MSTKKAKAKTPTKPKTKPLAEKKAKGPNVCPTCKGTGRDPNSPKDASNPLTCNDCGGSGTR